MRQHIVGCAALTAMCRTVCMKSTQACAAFQTCLIGLTPTSYEVSIHTQPNKILLVVVATEDSGGCAGFGVPQSQGAVSGS